MFSVLLAIALASPYARQTAYIGYIITDARVKYVRETKIPEPGQIDAYARRTAWRDLHLSYNAHSDMLSEEFQTHLRKTIEILMGTEYYGKEFIAPVPQLGRLWDPTRRPWLK